MLGKDDKRGKVLKLTYYLSLFVLDPLTHIFFSGCETSLLSAGRNWKHLESFNGKTEKGDYWLKFVIIRYYSCN